MLCLALAALGSDSKIAFESNESGNFEIWIVNDDGTGKTQLTDRLGAEQFSPEFSPDGSEIAYMSCDAAAAGTYTMTMVSGDDSEYLVEGCSAQFVIDP